MDERATRAVNLQRGAEGQLEKTDAQKQIRTLVEQQKIIIQRTHELLGDLEAAMTDILSSPFPEAKDERDRMPSPSKLSATLQENNDEFVNIAKRLENIISRITL